jgi:hypothetical protein
MELQTEDKVWMDTRNLSTSQPNKKLDWKFIEPYEITEVISPWANYVKLPSQLHIHHVQPISRLEKATQDPLQNQKQEPSPPVIVKEEEEHEVEKVDDSIHYRKQ